MQINVATNAMTNEGNEMTAQETPSLYDRLGGVYNIATVVDDLIDRVMVDDRLNANPRVDEAHHRVSPALGCSLTRVRELVERNVLRARYNCYGGIEVECAVVTGWTG